MFFALAGTGKAADPLIVQFQNIPLFAGSNFMPGDSVTRWIKMANQSGSAQTILIKAANVTDVGHMGDAMRIVIKEGAASLYDDTFSNFLNSSNAFPLSNLGNGNNTQYNLTISFNSSAGNTYQGKTLGFDILVGYSDNQNSNPTGQIIGGVFLSDNPDVTGGLDEENFPTPVPSVTPAVSVTPVYSPTSRRELSIISFSTSVPPTPTPEIAFSPAPHGGETRQNEQTNGILLTPTTGQQNSQNPLLATIGDFFSEGLLHWLVVYSAVILVFYGVFLLFRKKSGSS